jgi:predicted transcriptional regulator
MRGDSTGNGTLVVRIPAKTKTQLAERAREADRTRSAEVRRAIAAHLKTREEA